MSEQRDFPAIINEWTDALLQENSNAELREIPLILRLGMLGSRLIYAAHATGLNDALRISKEVHDERRTA